MSGIVLLGDPALCNNFVNEYVKKNNIRAYNIFEYQEPLKISEVRGIKRLLGIKSQEKRIFIFHSDPTIEAQNALLKTLEELPEDTTIIFTTQKDLLPTILSRCQIVNVGVKTWELEENKKLEILVDRLSVNQDVISSILIFSDSLFSEKGDNFDEMLLYLRKILLDAILKDDFITLRTVFKILKLINSFYPTIYSNNLNKRLLFERALISESLKNLPS